jgi:hypothetical protein
MRRILIATLSLVIALAACGDDDAGEGVASLSDSTSTTMSADVVSENERAVLAATACLRENGLDIPDPEMDADGNVDLDNFLEIAQGVDPEVAEVALEACADVIAEVDLGFERIDLTALEDTLVEFAACMRDNGFDLPDPDFASALEEGPFGGDIDIDDPAFETALENCDQILEQIDLTDDDG